MKSSKSLVTTLIILIVISALYRVIPGRPSGFTPQLAMALFGGAMIKDKKWAFALPLFSMFLSDLLFELLFKAGISSQWGFYEGQLATYIIMAGLTLLSFTLKRITVLRVTGYSIMLAVLYFVFSNGAYWLGGGIDIRSNLPLEKSFAGLMQSYTQGLPFFKGYLAGTLVFSAVLFGGYYLLNAGARKTVKAGQA